MTLVSMKERLEELMQLLNLTPTQFANEIGIQRTTLQHILSGRNEASLKIIMAIHSKYPDVELEWLLNGKGYAIPVMQQNDSQNQDYPLFPGMESTVFSNQGKDNSEFSNVKEEKSPSNTRKRANNKGVNSNFDNVSDKTQKRIKEVVIFFEDGTYQKFSSELKK